jgi:hypothetical protein
MDIIEYYMSPLYKLRRKLAQSIVPKQRVYLDTKFWNTFCDIELGQVRSGSAFDVLVTLRGLCGAGRMVCPVEYNVLNEVLRQRLPEKRAATAALVDELSAGTVIAAAPDRVFLETLRFAQSAMRNEADGPPPIDEVWTRPAFAIGHLTPDNPGLSESDYAWVVELTHEQLWDLSFSDIVDGLSRDPAPVAHDPEVVRQMNTEKRDPANQHATFRELYLSEVHGAVDAFESSLVEVTQYLFAQAGGDPSTVTDEERSRSTDLWKRMIVNTFRLKGAVMARRFPTIHTYATAHARVRRDVVRSFQPNDFADFGHAAAALGYCSCFATERSLAELIRQSKLDVQYSVAIVTDCDQLSEWLATLPPPAGPSPQAT